MDHFAGLDVSVKETSICIVDDTGRIVREVKVASEPEDLLQILSNPAYHFKRIGLEAGPLSQWLFSALADAGLPVIWCSEASCHSSGCKSRQQRSPVAVVVISRNGEGDRPVESREVKAPDGWAFQSDPYRGASNLTGCSQCVNQEAPKASPARNGLREDRECRAAQISAKASSASKFWTEMMIELPGVKEDGMSGRNVQRKLGTTRGSPRRSRTAKASRISRRAVKS